MYHSYVKTFYLDELALLSTTGLLFSLRMPKVELKSGRRRRGGQPQHGQRAWSRAATTTTLARPLPPGCPPARSGDSAKPSPGSARGCSWTVPGPARAGRRQLLPARSLGPGAWALWPRRAPLPGSARGAPLVPCHAGRHGTPSPSPGAFYLFIY